jgi:hypothetical protein
MLSTVVSVIKRMNSTGKTADWIVWMCTPIFSEEKQHDMCYTKMHIHDVKGRNNCKI